MMTVEQAINVNNNLAQQSLLLRCTEEKRGASRREKRIALQEGEI
jgi:hypothetical protein